MGRATRWLRSLLGGKKDTRDQKDNAGTSGGERKEKRRWSFGKFGRSSGDGEAQNPVPAADSASMESFYTEREGQNMHAIAVAVATTAAAASAAVTAAQAAAVRLQSQGRGTLFNGVIEKWAAVKIQTAFRGYLAKKALRALKALVKLQALVRGYLVRKQAAATLHRLQALMRAQAAARQQNSRSLAAKDGRFPPEIRPRKSYERFNEQRSEQLAPVHSRRLSMCLDSPSYRFDRSPKIVEMDTYRTKSRSSLRTTHSVSKPTEDQRSLSISSPLPCRNPPRLSIATRRISQDQDSSLSSDDRCRYSRTAYNTPRYMSYASNTTPVTPAKSLNAVDGVLRRILNMPSRPNYMENTRSSVAKVRSQSAPKQRPELAGPRKRMPLNEVVESRASLSGVGSRKSCSQAQGAFNFKSAVVERLDKSVELGRDYYLQKTW